VTVDIGFGDSVDPGIEEIDLPVLLDLPAPHLRAYARETVVAEKFHAMVTLGRANSRMKDFYDVWLLSKTHEFDNERLARAIAGTFARRGTTIPEGGLPEVFTAEFSRDGRKLQQWSAFIRDLSTNPPSFEVVAAEIARFLDTASTQARALLQKP
jgi:predicted nucleotidyltransferase component of viral defense system